ncbi:MAG TPA: DUF6443 domain-containing protein, partial [Chloroflexota bacterium]|nr:DUF6443 domain-containing protein [Chloroflexota bacterium]
GLYDTNNPPNAKQLTLHYYDNNITTHPANNQPLTLGELTLSRSLLVDQPINPSPPGANAAYPSVDTRYQYDNFGNVTHVTTYKGYGAVGYYETNWNYVTQPGNNSTAMTQNTQYSSDGLVVTSVSNPKNHTLATTYDLTFPWLPASVTDVNNNRTNFYKYDPFGRLYEVYDGVTNHNNNYPLTRYHYWDNTWNNGWTSTSPFVITAITRPAATTWDIRSEQSVQYDGLGRAIQQRSRGHEVSGVAGQDIVTTMGYDALGRAVCASTPFNTNWTESIAQVHFCDAQASQSQTQYDALGRMLIVTSPDGSSTLNTYLIEPLTGLITINTNPNGYRQASITDALGRLTTIHEFEDKAQIYEAEVDMQHMAGSNNDNGAWESPSVAEGSPHYLTYGPYESPDAIGTGQVAVFRLAIDVANAPNEAVAMIDVSYNNTIVAQRILYRHEFEGGINNFSDFVLPFNTTGLSGSNLEYRVYWLDKAKMAHDHTRILWQQNFAETRYEYDIQGNLIDVYDADNNQTHMEYDALGRKISMDDPDMGGWEYEYDPTGSLIRQTDNAGQVLCFAYDTLNRLEHKAVDATPADDCPPANNFPTSGENHLATYEYDPANAVGQLYRVSWGPSPGQNQDTFSYDSLGRLTQQTRRLDNHMYSLTTTSFDPLNRPLTVQYPDGETVTLTYDREGENSLTVGGTSLVNNITYNQRGQMITLSRPGSLPDTTFSYYLATGTAGNSNFRLQTIQHGTGNDALPNFTYNYDRVGNILGINTITDAETDVQAFDYDHLNRLVEASGSTGSPLTAYHHTYGYNAIGNLVSRTDLLTGVAPVYTYEYPEGPDAIQPHAVTEVKETIYYQGGSTTTTVGEYSYDENGNMKTRQDESGDFTQKFDIENRLVRVTDNATGALTQFFYDASGQRVKTIQPDQTVIYSPFPNYDEEHRDAQWVTLNAPAVNLSTPDDGDRSLSTADAPGWGLSLSQGTSWAATLLPVAVDDLAATADAGFPATSLYTGSGIGAPHTPGGRQ